MNQKYRLRHAASSLSAIMDINLYSRRLAAVSPSSQLGNLPQVVHDILVKLYINGNSEGNENPSQVDFDSLVLRDKIHLPMVYLWAENPTINCATVLRHDAHSTTNSRYPYGMWPKLTTACTSSKSCTFKTHFILPLSSSTTFEPFSITLLIGSPTALTYRCCRKPIINQSEKHLHLKTVICKTSDIETFINRQKSVLTVSRWGLLLSNDYIWVSATPKLSNRRCHRL